MSLFEDLNRFLENRLDEFLRNNPHLELQALEEQLAEQEKDTLRLIIELQAQEKTLQNEILTIAQDIQRWHERVEKAKAHGRQDLSQAAQEREAALLHQGNQVWGKMTGVKQRIAQTKELQHQIETRRAEVKAKAREVAANRANAKYQSSSQTSGWNQKPQRNISSGKDPLEEQFSRWETEAELEEMKRKMGR
ncbi:MAG TPA: TIGR04376 family protein [Cyanobacteria bacterium UBA11149]|nr:TIGR04376 family protein [Cyanobacteria bacterium UBA11367]HBE59313.1 TIGR04376 family protein [Cyanobacteria bacterium UBA11366]HBK63692.1 TIGR04376 family protein [Cyanobacteria bacterium UBA11166]HBR75755.1 TIGR04376 family protein [Cyanobacteria bacterium UBA11159]HBS70942.1 TIGR04376 family protein [Cyanobacteria bacterium UBA11153]HBW89419.1 TIGR04376 family protein [Cyanobacteria bacterium UBA11149]HCA98102.1 TIGR04376 family protein [Cyanobacteria bacterium UBA9226]